MSMHSCYTKFQWRGKSWGSVAVWSFRSMINLDFPRPPLVTNLWLVIISVCMLWVCPSIWHPDRMSQLVSSSGLIIYPKRKSRWPVADTLTIVLFELDAKLSFFTRFFGDFNHLKAITEPNFTDVMEYKFRYAFRPICNGKIRWNAHGCQTERTWSHPVSCFFSRHFIWDITCANHFDCNVLLAHHLRSQNKRLHSSCYSDEKEQNVYECTKKA